MSERSYAEDEFEMFDRVGELIAAALTYLERHAEFCERRSCGACVALLDLRTGEQLMDSVLAKRPSTSVTVVVNNPIGLTSDELADIRLLLKDLGPGGAR